MSLCLVDLFFFNDTATTEIYTTTDTLSLHDALPISRACATRPSHPPTSKSLWSTTDRLITPATCARSSATDSHCSTIGLPVQELLPRRTWACLRPGAKSLTSST